MLSLRLFLAGILSAASIRAGGAVLEAPAYTSAGIVNAASYTADALAPNAIASVFGTNLSYETRSVTAHDLTGGGLPTSLGGVSVFVGGIAAGLYYVSPTQVNFLIPNILIAAKLKLAIVRESVAGPYVDVVLHTSGPGLFQNAEYQVIATHLDGSLIAADAPATGGEWIVLYAEGLGRTVPDAGTYSLASGAAPIQDIGSLSVLVDGKASPPENIYYAGLTPGFAGLYQINLKLPDALPSNPEVRIGAGAMTSIPKTWLPVN